ncbi:unnamed protein product [Brachionus calyciflorus]|uniref:RNA-directed DNA polymerase from mobile element jockey-like n=1 Tax=Brachionus calyciflorus TaxID=104777 RepID=A0A813M3A3_9BILA|nr:unnamed protein product [Brachionus calyciflorus]
MGFNFSKCKVMHLGNRGDLSNREYSFNIYNGTQQISHTLETTKSERDLGIIIRDDLKWNDQINSAISKANSSLSRLKRAFPNWNIQTFKILYNSFVRPHLEYAAVTWNPFKKQDIKLIENVQRRATKCVSSLRNKSYEERLKILNLITLKDRRERGDLIQLFKIEKKINLIEWYHPLIQAPNTNTIGPSSSTRSNKRKYRQFVKSCPPRNNFFTNRTANAWNMIPDNLIDSNTVNAFKNKYDKLTISF